MQLWTKRKRNHRTATCSDEAMASKLVSAQSKPVRNGHEDESIATALHETGIWYRYSRRNLVNEAEFSRVTRFFSLPAAQQPASLSGIALLRQMQRGPTFPSADTAICYVFGMVAAITRHHYEASITNLSCKHRIEQFSITLSVWIRLTTVTA